MTAHQEHNQTPYEKYDQFCRDNAQLNIEDFFNRLTRLFNVSIGTAYNIWYADQRSWFEPEMMEEIIRLDKPGKDDFVPSLTTGGWDWDRQAKKFVPERH